jgi:hypothetical protein
MGFTVFVRDQITPRVIPVHGATCEETVPNPGVPPVRPATFVELIWEDLSDLYGDDPTKRSELWRDAAGVATYKEIVAACPGLLDSRRAPIRAEGDRRLAALATPYMDHERETWHVQQAEAEAWSADHTASVPMITALAAGRGITVDVLVEKILANVNLFRSASGAILGQQQALLDRIAAATDIDALLAIAWPQP